MSDFNCTACGLYRTRTKIVLGEGPDNPDIVLIGEAPGKEEDFSGRPFVGGAGDILNNLLTHEGLSRHEVYITNVVKCRPPGNRNPNISEIRACSDILRNEIDSLKPKIVIALGRIAAHTLIGTDKSIAELRKECMILETFETNSFSRQVTFTTYHPAATLYDNKKLPDMIEDFKRIGEYYRKLKVR